MPPPLFLSSLYFFFLHYYIYIFYRSIALICTALQFLNNGLFNTAWIFAHLQKWIVFLLRRKSHIRYAQYILTIYNSTSRETACAPTELTWMMLSGS